MSADQTKSVTINTASITITEPVKGAKPDFSPQAPSDANYTVTQPVTWFVDYWYGEYDNELNGESGDYTFKKAGDQVKVRVGLRANSGYEFGKKSNLTCYVNGQTAEVTWNTGDLVICEYTFKVINPLLIYNVSATISEPVVGSHPDFTPVLPADAAYTLEAQDGVHWYKGSSAMTLSNTFERNSTYYVMIYLVPKGGYQFASDVTASINGKEAELFQGSNSLSIKCTFDLKTASITSVSIITPPAVGAKPDYNPVLPSYANYTCDNGVSWFDETVERWLEKTDSFLADHVYYFRVNLYPKTGYEFADDLTAAVNGNAVTAELRESGDSIYARLTYIFPVLGSKSFTDVQNPNDYYFIPVYWAVARGITSGTSATTFSPGKECTRGQIVTFLWKAMGSPEPSSTSNPFTDVKSSDYFYKPVLWAKENGITSGTSETTFSPGKPCTRGQIVTFLWKALWSPEPTDTSNPFTDVKTTDYFYKPVLWAKEEGVTSGTSATTFSPGKTCTRGQAMTFLYKAVG